jgi:hypothetical protein
VIIASNATLIIEIIKHAKLAVKMFLTLKITVKLVLTNQTIETIEDPILSSEKTVITENPEIKEIFGQTKT